MGEPSANETVCIHCQEPIRPGAHRCPSCLSWQSRWAGDSQNPRLEILLGLLATAIAVALLLVWVISDDDRPEPASPALAELEVIGSEVHVLSDSHQTGLAVTGEVANRGETPRKNVYFQVECFDQHEQLIDAFPARSYQLVLPPGEVTRFKLIEDHPLTEPDRYARCDVEIRWTDVIK